MKRKALQVLLLALAAAALAGGPYDKVGNVSVPTNVPADRVSGLFYAGDGTGYNLYLDLQADGTFSCTWRGCLGVYGTSAGTWSVTTNRIALKAAHATNMLKKRPLNNLDVLVEKDEFILVNADDNGFFLKHGPSRYSCFHKRPVSDRKNSAEQDQPGARRSPGR